MHYKLKSKSTGEDLKPVVNQVCTDTHGDLCRFKSRPSQNKQCKKPDVSVEQKMEKPNRSVRLSRFISLANSTSDRKFSDFTVYSICTVDSIIYSRTVESPTRTHTMYPLRSLDRLAYLVATAFIAQVLRVCTCTTRYCRFSTRMDVRLHNVRLHNYVHMI
jgi:hypothetical protein